MFSIPTIPDNIFKLSFTIGIGLLFYAIYISDKSNEGYTKALREYQHKASQLSTEGDLSRFKFKQVKNDIQLLALGTELKDHMTITDSSIQFYSISPVKKELSAIQDSIQKKLKEFDLERFMVSQKDAEIAETKEEWERANTELNTISDQVNIMMIFCFFFICLGFGGMVYEQQINDLRQIAEKGKPIIACQSCGRTFNSMVTRSKDLNGVESKSFCSSCYHNNVFTDPTLTKNKVIAEIVRQRKAKSPIKKRYISNHVKRLERWKETSYF